MSCEAEITLSKLSRMQNKFRTMLRGEIQLSFYFYMHNFHVYWISIYVFRSFRPLSGVRLYIQHQVYVIEVRWLLASGHEMSAISCPLASSQLTWKTYTWCCMYSLTPDDGWKDRPKHGDWYSINSKIVHLVGFTIEIQSRCTVLWTSKLSFYSLRRKYYNTVVMWRGYQKSCSHTDAKKKCITEKCRAIDKYKFGNFSTFCWYFLYLSAFINLNFFYFLFHFYQDLKFVVISFLILN